MTRPPHLDPTSPAARHAHVRYLLRVRGADRRCPTCDAAPGESCTWRPEAHPTGTVRPEGLIFCAERGVPPDAKMALDNGILFCEDAAAWDRLLPGIEALRLAHFPDLDCGPAPIWAGYAKAG